MALRPDDNDRAQLGALGGYLDDAAPWSVPPAPASGTVPRLLSAREGAEAIRAALLSSASLLVLRSTTGAGKSEEMRQATRVFSERGQGVALFVPTHRLGEQTQRGLDDLHVASSRPVGVARVRLPVVDGGGDAPACVHHEAAHLAALAGVRVRKEVCVECPHKDRYQGQDGAECPAYAEGAEKTAVAVLQQPLLARTLADATRRLLAPAPKKSKLPPPPRVVFVDELPPLAVHAPLDGARALWARERLAGEMPPDLRETLEPVMLAALQGAEDGREGLSLRGILALSGASEETIERELGELRELDGADLWRDDLPGRLARRSLVPATRDQALSRLDAVAKFTVILEVLVDAAHEPDRPALRIDAGGTCYLTAAARWTRRIRPYLAAGGRVRLLDATAPVDALRGLFGDLLDVAAVEVEDAPGLVERRFRVWQHGARSRHTSAGLPVAEQIRGPLRWLAERLQERGSRVLGLLTHKPLADALRGWLLDRKADPAKPAPAWCPDELAELVAAGLEILPGHFGGQRGLDTWAGCDVLATLGDPWPNLGAARAEALALGLDDPEAWALEQTRSELLQAWGRARTVHRASPVLVVHLGSLALAPEASWAPQWAGVRAEKASRGRPPTTLPLSDPATWAEERARLGLSARAHAAALGLSWGTYRRKVARGAVEEGSGGSEAPPENTAKEVGHKWSQGVSGVSEGTPSALLNSVPIFGPPTPEPPQGGQECPSPGVVPLVLEGLPSNNAPSTDPLAPTARHLAQTEAREARGSTTGATFWAPGRSGGEGAWVALPLGAPGQLGGGEPGDGGPLAATPPGGEGGQGKLGTGRGLEPEGFGVALRLGDGGAAPAALLRGGRGRVGHGASGVGSGWGRRAGADVELSLGARAGPPARGVSRGAARPSNPGPPPGEGTPAPRPPTAPRRQPRSPRGRPRAPGARPPR